MIGSLTHRGPDDEGFESDPDAGVFMGFRRLSILDLSAAGHQPMTSASGRYIVTFNGEIYNFQELRAELQRGGATFRGGSDTEVMLAAFERWGCRDAVERFRGMFAFALWDRRDRVFWLARDRMGIKPLYFLQNAGSLGYASEARAFHHCPLWERKGNAAAAREYLQRLYVPGPQSILQGVERVCPGEILEYRVGRRGVEDPTRRRYWDMAQVAARSAQDPVRNESEAVNQLADILREAVRLRMIADVPVGAFLSGGIDSSLVVALMQEASSTPVRTFTVRFDDPAFDEGPIAARVASSLGTQHTEVAFQEQEVMNELRLLPELSDEPMANPSLLPTLLISRVARRDVVVALSGDGGDELFGGYNRYLHGARMLRTTGFVPRPLRVLAARGLEGVARLGPVVTSVGRRFQPASMGDQQSPLERLLKLAGVLEARNEAEAYDRLMSVGSMSGTVAMGDGPRSAPWLDASQRSMEERLMLTDQMRYLPDDLLTKVDRASMWESLEARVPILDQEVVRFSWRLGVTLKIRRGVTKWPLRQIVGRYLPADVLERPKMGFTVPVQRWLSEGLREWARDTLNSDSVARVGVMNPTSVETLWRSFEAGRSELALSLWTAAVLHAWANTWRVTF